MKRAYSDIWGNIGPQGQSSNKIIKAEICSEKMDDEEESLDDEGQYQGQGQNRLEEEMNCEEMMDLEDEFKIITLNENDDSNQMDSSSKTNNDNSPRVLEIDKEESISISKMGNITIPKLDQRRQKWGIKTLSQVNTVKIGPLNLKFSKSYLINSNEIASLLLDKSPEYYAIGREKNLKLNFGYIGEKEFVILVNFNDYEKDETQVLLMGLGNGDRKLVQFESKLRIVLRDNQKIYVDEYEDYFHFQIHIFGN